ncbi:hypothetical protein K458DRAFT_267806, partial [Lentithecium fluviatile CBS 122367]
TMILTGILLAPTAVPHAVQDLQDLKTIIDAAATTIKAAPNNSSWGFLSPASPAGAMGTADLISNITTTVLRATYLLNIDKTAWITVPNNTNSSSTNPDSTAPTPPFPSTTAPSNTSLETPYTDYISSIPTLSSALTTLGRAWHKEMNKPVWEAIDALQQTISTFSSEMLSADLIHSQSVLRTIRASSSLEDAQQAWARLLNLPGAANSQKRWIEVEVETSKVQQVRANGTEGAKRPLATGGFYTHKDLWGRAPAAEARARQ